MLSQSSFRRKPAPVNGATYGMPAAAATGVAERDVGVPTAPIKANTSSLSISAVVLAMAASGSYLSSSDLSSSCRPCTPPARLASSNAARIPRRRPTPSSAAGPLSAADCPKTTRSSYTPVSPLAASGAVGRAGAAMSPVLRVPPVSPSGSLQAPSSAAAAMMARAAPPTRMVSVPSGTSPCDQRQVVLAIGVLVHEVFGHRAYQMQP